MAVAIAIALFGAVGSLARYAVTRFVDQRVLGVFPWDTFVVNATGCFLVAVAVTTLVDRHHTPAWLRLGLIVGFMGAYTTFSAFAQETYDLAIARDYLEAVANAAGSVSVGVLAVLVGTFVGRAL